MDTHQISFKNSYDDSNLSSRSSISNLTGLMRMGKTRTNRSSTLPQVNKRFHSLEKDYRKLLASICRSLSIPVVLIQNMAASKIGKGLSELVSKGCIDLQEYLSLFSNDISFAIGTNTELLKTILEISQTLQKFSQQQSTSSLDIMKALHTVIRSLMAATHIYYDNHTSKVISWWFPQFIEILTVVLLLSETNLDANQVLKDTNTMESYFNCYRANLVIVVYMLSGAYLVDQNFTKKVTELKNNPSLEQKFALELNEKTKIITNSIRDRLFSSNDNSLDKNDKLKTYFSKKKQTNQIKNWKDIYNALPSICSTCCYLFLLDVPQEISTHIEMDISDPSIRNSLQLSHQVLNPLQNVLEKVSKISLTLECIRSNWPIVFNEIDSKLLIRTTLVVMAETEQLCKLEVIPFAVPESWENWILFIGLLKSFSKYLILLIQRKAPKNEVENIIGKMIVQSRFINQLAKIEQLESCILNFSLI